MKEIAKFKNIQPAHAEGKVCIDLTDPLTGKVKERIEGNNHVFTESLFSSETSSTNFWMDAVSESFLCMNNTNLPINTKFPYLFGQTVGYGKPSTAGTGLYRGAYNVANQVLRELSLDSVRWKFQYDFTTAQVNDVPINVVGLTNQYTGNHSAKKYLLGSTTNNTTNITGANDGRYCYSCSKGFVTVYDMYMDTTNTIDLSATVGTVTTQQVAYALDTGRCYIYVYSSTPALRMLYEYNGRSFSTLINTYNVTNLNASSSYPSYIYGDNIYFFGSNNAIYADFVDNTVPETVPHTPNNNLMQTEISSYTGSSSLATGTCVMGSKYIFCASGSSSTTPVNRRGGIYDLATNSFVAYVYPPAANYTYALCRHPFTTEELICVSGYLYHNAAISAYKLATPITKTIANGLTVTYELEVFW
jgi:hypothetical protein